MKNYISLKPLTIYVQNKAVLPKGEKPGFGNCVFILSPTKEDCESSLMNESILKTFYKFYMIDFIYKEKIGYKRYSENNTTTFKKQFQESPIEAMQLVSNINKASVLGQRRNVIINMGEWMKIFFQNQIKSANNIICENFFNFLSNHLNDSSFEAKENARIGDYKKIIYIDIHQWIHGKSKFGLSREQMTNPLSILLVTLYKFPELLFHINGIDIFIGNSAQHKFLKLTPDTLIAKNYRKIKQKVMSMINDEDLDDYGMDEEIAIDGKSPVNKPIEKMTSDEILDTRIINNENRRKLTREKIIANLTKNLVGTTDDFTDDEDDSYIELDSEEDEEVLNIANNYLDEHPDLLDEDPEIAEREVKKAVKKSYYVKSYSPKYTDKQLARIHELQNEQDQKIGNLNDSISNMESKIIDTSDFSNVVQTTNPDIIESKFVNFDRSYNSKKLEQDIDNCVGMLSNATFKVFVTKKEVEDTSTSLDLKRTITYHLEDVNGKKMKLKFDIPVIYDDHFMMIKGNRKILQHMLVLKPLVKTGKGEVQIVSNYQKMFIMRKGSMDLRTNTLLRFLLNKNAKNDLKVITGNGVATNKNYRSTLEYNAIASKVIYFEIGESRFILDTLMLDKIISEEKIDISKIDRKKDIIIGIDNDKKPIVMKVTDSFVETIISYLPEDFKNVFHRQGGKYNGGKLLMYSETKPLSKRLPLILLLLYWEGFSKVMQKANIEYKVIPKSEFEIDNVDLYEWGITDLDDGYIQWKRYPPENSMLMNGLNTLPIYQYSIDDLDNKEIYTFLLTNIYSFANQAYNLDQYYDFMIDPITKEILQDFHLPTDLVELCLLANKMLRTDEHSTESDMGNMRIRGNEILAYHTYKVITDAYNTYRKTQHRKNPQPISIKQDAVISSIMNQSASAMTDASSLNPVLEISKLRAITYKGENGMNMEHAFKLNIRSYNESMLGIMGITTSPDAGVGINRQLTLEPNVTSTRGYLNVSGEEHVNELNSAQLLSPSELLTPLGVQHDDPTRTSMAYKQTMYMVLVDDSDPVLIGNGAEKILPYHLSSDFVINAEDDGKVIEINENFLVVQYDNGKYRTIDMNPQFKKNSAAGFYIKSQLITDLKPGDSFKKNTILAWDDKAFKKEGHSPEVSMRLGPLIKVAIVPEWDIYEDSAPISKRASERMATDMVMPIKVSLHKDAFVSKMMKVGDHVNAGENVIVFDNYHEDPMVMKMIQELREEEREEIIEQNSNKKTSHYTGEIVGIDVITTVPVEDLSESLQKIVKENWKKLEKRDKILEKYKNPEDLNYYKSGNVISTSREIVKPDYNGKVKGEYVEDGVLITFHVGFKDFMSRGDKLASQFALKSTNSHVIEEGLEPWSESRPDEPIDLIVAPLSISARKTPSIFLAMFTNKILIEAKRHLRDYWNEN